MATRDSAADVDNPDDVADDLIALAPWLEQTKQKLQVRFAVLPPQCSKLQPVPASRIEPV